MLVLVLNQIIYDILIRFFQLHVDGDKNTDSNFKENFSEDGNVHGFGQF